ncbi:MAG TPA: Calx-beta domain-containing protein [Acidimicrobiia bacterium]|jgi:hypothetical protein
MRRKLWAVLSAVALIPIGVISAAVIDAPTPAGADTVNVPLSCQVSNVPVVGTQTQTSVQTTTAIAVDHVYQNGTFNLSVSAAPTSQASDLGSGATLRYLHDFSVFIPIPANSALVSFSISGGSNIGPGPNTISQSGGSLVMRVPGPVQPNTTFQLPTVNMTLRATGPALSTIQSRFGGTSYANPGLQFTVAATLPSPLGDADLLTSCYPTSTQPLSTTTIWPLDNVGPAITLTTPADGATYAQGVPVTASYSCNDGPFGVGVATCGGTVPTGTLIDTTTLGTRSFTVNATDTLGNASSQTAGYTVVSDPGIVVRNGWANESTGNQVAFKVALTRAPSQTVTVHYATQDGVATSTSDYVATSGDLTFNPGGATTQTVNVTVRDDTVFEPTESFSLVLSAPTHALISVGTGAGRIRDNDIPTVRVLGAVTTEGTGAVVPMKISLQGHANVPVTVSYATADLAETNHAVAGADYTAVSGALTFSPGAALTQTVNVPVLNDTAWEADAERFAFNITNPADGQTASAPGTILDDEPHPPVISVSNVTIREGDVGATRQIFIPVTLDRPAATATNVRWSTVNGTAVSPSDFTAQTNQQLVLEAGRVSGVIKVSVNGDALNEGNETFGVTLSSPFGVVLGTPTATITLLNDDAPTSTATTPVLSVSDVRIVEGDSGTSDIDIAVTSNIKAPAKVTAQVTTVGGTATSGVDYTAATKNVVLAKGATIDHVTIKLKNDLTVESDETFTVWLVNVVGATAGKPVGTVTIVDNDNPLPSTPTGIASVPSGMQLGGTEVSWNAATTPLADWPLTGYQYRVSVDGGATWSAWTSTGAGTSTWFIQNCGQGRSCTYQVRGVNKKGAGGSVGQATAAGLADLTSPAMTIATPTQRGNLDTLSATTISGDAGIEGGDTPSVGVNVYPCNGCTNVTPTYSAFATPSGGSWSVSPSLAPGVYTVQTAQADWGSHVTVSAPTTFEVRNAVFVSPFGNDANSGSVTAPKLTIGAAAAAAGAAGRPQVAVAAGTFAPASGVAISASVSVLGGFDETAGWTRPGTAGASGTADRNLSQISGVPQAVTVTGAVTVTLDALTIQGLNTGLGAGASVYGVRAVGASAGSPANVTITNSKVSAAAGLGGSSSSTNGSNATANGCNGVDGVTYTTGNSASCGGSGVSAAGGGGGGGAGAAFSPDGGNNGGNGGGGAAGGGGGSGSFTSGGAGGGGVGGAGGASGTAGPKGVNDAGAAGGTWAGRSGGSGGNGGSGGGAGGGGGGGGTGAFQNGGRGGGAGAGGTGGGGAGGGSFGGGSFAAYGFNASVTVTGSTLASATGGTGGDGADGGSGSSAGKGGNAFEQFFAGNGGGGGGGGGGAGGGGGGGGAGGPSVAVFHGGSGTVTVSSSTLTRSAAPALGGSGGDSGNGGGGGAGGLDGSNPADCLTLCGTVNSGGGGGAGGAGTPGIPGDAGQLCTKFDGTTCTP